MARTTPSTPRSISAVIPVYNGAATLRQLIDRLEPVLAAQAREYEVVLVKA